MKTKRIEMREEWFTSLPHAESKSFIDNKPVSRGEFMRVKCSAVRVLADETHSAGGKSVRHVLAEVNAS